MRPGVPVGARWLADAGFAKDITDRRTDIARRSRKRPTAADAFCGLRIDLFRNDPAIPRARKQDLEGHRPSLLELQMIRDRPAGRFRQPIAAREPVRLAGGRVFETLRMQPLIGAAENRIAFGDESQDRELEE